MTPRILWADDEIGHLKSHILFLEAKGMQVTPVTNGQDAVDAVQKEGFDIVFLDEQMPGLSGIETLGRIKSIAPNTPVVMITKSEEENLMEDAIGRQIDDYLIKPVNPNQILLSLKKLLEGRQLLSQRVAQGYQQDFRSIGMDLMDVRTPDEWKDVYRRLTFWERQLEQSEDASMAEVLINQKSEANVGFGKFVARNYVDWVNSKLKPGTGDRPVLSPDLLETYLLPELKPGRETTLFILVDAMRYDQWKALEPILTQYYTVEKEDLYFSLLPTATQYARNSLFAGMWPLDISERFPKYWVNDDEEGGKNLHEADFLAEFIARKRLNIRHSYTKVITNEDGRDLVDNALNLLNYDLGVIVVNFIDLMTHARAEMSLIKELAPDEAGFRSLSRSWLEHSSLLAALKKLRDRNVRLVLTTDHGSIRVQRPLKIIGDRQTTTNLRYKQGRNLNYDEKNRLILTIKKPQDARLPKSTVSGTYVFAMEDGYFVYPNNYNYYAGYFKDTFQHGGISLEEMLVPIITLVPKA